MSQEYIKTENGIVPIPNGFDEVEYLSNSLLKVKKNEMFGICNPVGKIIVEAKYKRIVLLESSFIVADNDKTVNVFNHRGEIILKELNGYVSSIFAINKYLFLYLGDDTILYNNKGELIWRNSLTLSRVSKFEDESVICYLKTRTKDWKVGALSIDGKVIIPNEYNNIEYEKGFFKVEYTFSFLEKNVYRIFDIHGNQLFDDKYKKYSRILILENVIIAEEAAYNNDGDIYLYDFSGQVLICAKDIAPTDNGMYVISTWNKSQRRYCDGVIDSCGNELLPSIYHRIEAYKDGVFYISRNNYGRYKGKLDEKEINSKGVRKLSLSGNIEVQNGENSVWLPSDYNWGTDFVNGLSIVCSNWGIGVIDSKFNVIVEPYNRDIDILDNNTILVNHREENDSQGITDWNGNIIVPKQFKRIKQITEDKYLANSGDKWCIYDNKGNLLSEDEYAAVRNFKFSFEDFDIHCAVVYKKKERINNYRIRYFQGGVINENGEELIPCIYDKVTLYPPHYAICVRNKIFTIVDFSNSKQSSFPKMEVKHVFRMDKLGRCVYSDDCVYDVEEGRWKGGTEGVFSLDGVIVPSGKYEDIHLLDNGLMQVCVNQQWGMLNQKGEELLSLKYTKISDFRGEYATICQGGEYVYSVFETKIRNGKWGVINKKAEFVVDCIHDTESLHGLVIPSEIIRHPVMPLLGIFRHPEKLLSLSFDISPKSTNTNIEYIHEGCDDSDDGSGYTKEEIDQMYRDAFDNNPELEWNID